MAERCSHPSVAESGSRGELLEAAPIELRCSLTVRLASDVNDHRDSEAGELPLEIVE
jgi:hypothetical protein